MTYNEVSPLESKMYLIAAIFCGLLLFVALSQPVWNGAKMSAEFKSDCFKRGGVLLTHDGTFGTTYECASRLDK